MSPCPRTACGGRKSPGSVMDGAKSAGLAPPPNAGVCACCGCFHCCRSSAIARVPNLAALSLRLRCLGLGASFGAEFSSVASSGVTGVFILRLRHSLKRAHQTHAAAPVRLRTTAGPSAQQAHAARLVGHNTLSSARALRPPSSCPPWRAYISAICTTTCTHKPLRTSSPTPDCAYASGTPIAARWLSSLVCMRV
ncbi:hypothetical protein HYPSUDRAFT_218532 [Hypholoma sublateritium FD-334 SS-4]|uniref:Uncharacterized protein n=1 Tax=Hypholoma sublateritium (strain FD-334 SS-4) TaxID=945553 RepID=A0A0D2NMH9_HYPSF|nr:hypothetical protein HYPSUDRAFT_218532 [Hypholoma sublateritium FD-334 SS-4]